MLSAAGAGLMGSAVVGDAEARHGNSAIEESVRSQSAALPLAEFAPKSMLHVPDTHIARARFPVVDFHTHVSRRRAQRPNVPAADLVKTMDVVNVQTMVNLTGGSGEELATVDCGFHRAFPRD